jgi:glycosyltransferase involved in cell wall biosynthesis
MKVTAIVSTYNAERFLEGRLDDLLAQTLYQQGQLEIVVVNSGSRQGERYIARDYAGCITYIESLREPIYCAWNRGIRIATGEYITNANTDDRLRPDALESLARALDTDQTVDLVYADAWVVSSENARWGQPYTLSTRAPYYGEINWPDFEPALLLRAYFGGPNPMWRRQLHQRFGYFDESYQLAGDYEFALRLVARGVRFKHIQDKMTLFYDNGININHSEQASMETRRALLKWRDRIWPAIEGRPR